MVHIRQSRPDSGLGFQVKVLAPFSDVPSSLGSGALRNIVAHQELIDGGGAGNTILYGYAPFSTRNCACREQL